LIDRRTPLAGMGAGALAVPDARAAATTRVEAAELRAGGLSDPLGIDDAHPTLSWQLRGPDGTMQRAYRLRVAGDPATLGAGTADLWNSGRVESADTAVR
jgi:alpha-L-rhamnosidase